MLYNKNNLLVAKIANKSTGYHPHRALTGVLLTKDKSVATDSYRLIEMSTPRDFEVNNFPKVEDKSPITDFEPVLIQADYLKRAVKLPETITGGHKNLMAITEVEDNKIEVVSFSKDGTGNPIFLPRIVSEEFPKYEKLFPKGQPTAEINLNGVFLAEVAEIVAKVSSINKITLKIYGKNDPVVIEAQGANQDARSLLMPLRS